jgi:uncharacterized protein GlcG (DUF336 family)
MTTLAQADAIAAATLEHGRTVGAAPLTVAVLDAGGAVLGAVGVSGDVSDVDEVCALAGVTAAGLLSDPVPEQ